MSMFGTYDESTPDTQVMVASVDLLSRVIATVFGGDFDLINMVEPRLGDPSPPKFLEAIAIALGGDNLKTPLPEAFVEGCTTVASAIERAGSDIEDGADAIAIAIDNLASVLRETVKTK